MFYYISVLGSAQMGIKGYVDVYFWDSASADSS